MPTLHKAIPAKFRTAKAVEGAANQPDTIEAVESLLQLENEAWDLQGLVLQLCDEVESSEPLQAKQTYQNILVRLEAIGEFVNGTETT